MNIRKIKSSRGMTMAELVVAVSVLAFFITSMAISYSVLLRLAFSNISSVKATFLAEETLEVLRFLKVSDWDNNIAVLSSDQDYFLNLNGADWEITQNYFLIGGFERKFVLEDVKRDSSGNIGDTGTIDPNTKRITAFVSWQKSDSATTTKSMTAYISKI